MPLLVLIPALDSTGQDMAVSLGWAAFKAGVLLTLLLVGGQRVMRWWLTLVARRKSEELFILNLLLVTLGLAWLTEHFGLSLALGAFVAGMLVAETEYKHQVETDIRPFHDVLLGLFFITIGMKLDWRPVLDQWQLVLVLSLLPVAAKFVLVTVLARLFGTPSGIVVNTVTALMFMRGRDSDLNIRGAFLHMAADAVVSAGVVVAGGLALWFGNDDVHVADLHGVVQEGQVFAAQVEGEGDAQGRPTLARDFQAGEGGAEDVAGIHVREADAAGQEEFFGVFVGLD